MHPPTIPRTSTARVVPRALEISHALVPVRNAAYTTAMAPMNTMVTTSFQVSPIACTSFKVLLSGLPHAGHRGRAGSPPSGHVRPPGRGRCPGACGLGIPQREITLVLLGGMQAEDRVQPVK